MKSIKEIAWNVSEDEYRADPALSYSTIARFEREGWRNTEHLFDKIETPSLTFGSMVDTMLTEGMEEFHNKFLVCEFPSISDTLITITKYLHDSTNKIKLSDIDDNTINDAALINNYYSNDKYKNYRIKTIKEQCGEYYSLLSLSKGKKVVSTAEYNTAVSCVNELRENTATKKYFIANPFETNIEKVFQLKFKSEYKAIPVRCMFDLLVVFHDKKVIIPVDLKTSSHYEEDFEESFLTWKYYIQAQLYSYILRDCISKDDYFKDFTIKSYKFIVINKKTQAPIVWDFPHNFCETAMLDSKGNTYRNWREIVPELNYYLNKMDNKYSKEAIENNYNLSIKCLQALKQE